MKFTTEKLEPEALLLELQELEFVLEKSRLLCSYPGLAMKLTIPNSAP